MHLEKPVAPNVAFSLPSVSTLGGVRSFSPGWATARSVRCRIGQHPCRYVARDTTEFHTGPLNQHWRSFIDANMNTMTKTFDPRSKLHNVPCGSDTSSFIR
jgi:hypothetical protein